MWRVDSPSRMRFRASVASREGAPILLVSPSSIPGSIRAELQRLRPGRIVILGGVHSVSGSVKTELATFTTGGVTRLAGADRFAASADILAKNFPVGVGTVYVTNRLKFPDALAGAPVAAKEGPPSCWSRPRASRRRLPRKWPG